jgi:hypothetical protein
MSQNPRVRETHAGEDGATMLALWRQGLSHQGAPQARLDWFYRAHPCGAPRVFILEQDELPIGTATLARRAVVHAGRDASAGVLVDFVLHADQRTLFPALALQRAVRETALADLAVVFGFPNRRSLAVVKRAGYRHVLDLERRVRVVRSARYLERLLPAWLARPLAWLADHARHLVARMQLALPAGWQARWLDAPDARFDSLWQRCRSAAGLIGVRDRAFLDWRFARAPGLAARFLCLDAEDGELLAYAVCIVDAEGLDVLDFLATPAAPRALSALMGALEAEVWRLGKASIALRWGGTAHVGRALAAAGFVIRDCQPVTVSGPVDEEDWRTAGNWYLTGADLDADH